MVSQASISHRLLAFYKSSAVYVNGSRVVLKNETFFYYNTAIYGGTTVKWFL